MTELGHDIRADPGVSPGGPDEALWPFASTRSGVGDADASSRLFRPGEPERNPTRPSAWPPPNERGDADHLVELENEPSRVRGGGWLQGVAVLLAVFVAVVAGMTALWNSSSPTLESADVTVDDLVSPTVADEAFPSVLPTTTEVASPSVVPPATVTVPSEWVTVDDPTLGFVALLPSDPDVAGLGGEGQRVTSPGPFGSSLVIVVQPFPSGEAAFNDLGLVAGATEAVLGQPHQGEFTDLIGGTRIYDFTGQLGDLVVRGRTLLLDDRRVVLVQEVPASAAAEPDAVAAFERMLDGFQPRP